MIERKDFFLLSVTKKGKGNKLQIKENGEKVGNESH